MSAYEAVKVQLDPTPRQVRLLASHAGAARFAYNAGLAHVKAALDAGEKPEWSLFSLQHWWVVNRDTLAVDSDGAIWWHENSSMSYRSGLKALADALSNWSKSRKGKTERTQGWVPEVQVERPGNTPVQLLDQRSPHWCSH